MNNKFKSKFSTDLRNMIDLQVRLGYAEKSYVTRAVSFDRFCAEHYPDIDVVTEPLVFAWMQHETETGSYIQHDRISFSRLLADFQRSTGKNAFHVNTKFTAGKSTFVPYLFSDDELTELFKIVDQYSSENKDLPLLNSVYLRLTYTCGLRPKEGRELLRENVDLLTGEIRLIRSKYRISRTIIVSNDMLALLRIYVVSRDNCYPDSPYLFPNKKGCAYSSGYMNAFFQKCFQASKPGTPQNLLPHVRIYDLRHRFATAVLIRWLDQKIDISSRLPYLQSYMGHKSLSSTAYYIHLLPERLAKSAGIEWEKMNCLVPGVDLWGE